jgi:hypothetical protein
MTEAAITVEAISADDVAALRSADSVAFHHYQGDAFIRLYLSGRVGDPRVFTRREQILFPDTDFGVGTERSRLITCDGQGFGYGPDAGTAWRLRDEANAACFALLFGARRDPVWQTTAGVLRPGDRLSLRWVADNNCETIRSHGLHVDQLDLIAVRGFGSKARTFAFMVAHGVGPDNSARMIRRFG